MRHELNIEGHKIVALGFNEDKPGTPVFFIHGITASVNLWVTSPTPVFPEQFRWYSLSLPGHFPALIPPDFTREQLTPDLIARVLAEAIRQLSSGTPAIIIGHSTGGFAALIIAACYPELVRSVVSIGGFAQGTWYGVLRLAQIQARWGVVGAAMFKFTFKMLGVSFPVYRFSSGFYAYDKHAYFAFPELDTTLKLLFEDVRRLDLDAMLHYFNRMPDIDVSDWLARVQAPTLVITGDHDGIVPPEQAHLIAEKVPNSTLVELKGGGHMAMVERPDEYAKVITEWVLKFA